MINNSKLINYSVLWKEIYNMDDSMMEFPQHDK